jgi:DNA-binding LacI/PurR family transcriptional regulator
VARVTLKTVAERVGVSPMTVSNAFSRPDQLSAALREKILATAAELGYVGPDPAARTLARGATGTVGILFHGTPRHALSDEFSALFLAVIAEELGRGGLALTLLPNAGTADVVPVRDVAMDGAIVYSCSPTDGSVEWLRRRRARGRARAPEDRGAHRRPGGRRGARRLVRPPGADAWLA